MNSKWVKIGTPTTVEELIKVLESVKRGAEFGFINQPLQSLYMRENEDGTFQAGFQIGPKGE